MQGKPQAQHNAFLHVDDIHTFGEEHHQVVSLRM